MIDGLSFFVYATVIGMWTFVWAGLGVLVANSRDESPTMGFIQGALLGPVGVALIPFLASERSRADAKFTRHNDLGVTPDLTVPSSLAAESNRDLYG